MDLPIEIRQRIRTHQKPGDPLNPIKSKPQRKEGQTGRDKRLFAELMAIHKDPKKVQQLLKALKPKSRNQALMDFQQKKNALVRDVKAKGGSVRKEDK